MRDHGTPSCSVVTWAGGRGDLTAEQGSGQDDERHEATGPRPLQREGHRHERQPRGDEPTRGPGSVERRHDRTAEPVLEGHGLHVARGVVGPEAETIDSESGGKDRQGSPSPRTPRADEDERERDQDEREPQGAGAVGVLGQGLGEDRTCSESSTSRSISPRRQSLDSSRRSCRTGRRRVTEMKSSPWTKKAALMATRAGRRLTRAACHG